MRALRYVYMLALVAWLGGMITLGALVAPATFQVLQASAPDIGRALAGDLFGVILARFHYLVYAAAAILLIAPTAYHRILFRLGDKEHLVTVANRFTLAGLACVAVSITGALLLVTDLIFAGTIVVIATTAIAAVTCVLFWCLAPLRRRARLRRGRRALLQRRAKGVPVR